MRCVSTTFSVFLGQGAMSYATLRERAAVVESTGYDCLWLVDHMWPRGLPDVDFLEGWTAVTALALEDGPGRGSLREDRRRGLPFGFGVAPGRRGGVELQGHGPLEPASESRGVFLG